MSEQFTTPKAPILATCIRQGIIVSGVGVLFTMILFLMDMDTSSVAQVLGYFVLLGGILVGSLEYRDTVNQGYIKYSQVIAIGVLISVVSAFILGIFSAIYIEYINPEMMEQLILQQEEKFVEQGLSDEDIEGAISMMRKFTHPMFSIPISIIWYAVVGLLISSVVGVFIKNE